MEEPSSVELDLLRTEPVTEVAAAAAAATEVSGGLETLVANTMEKVLVGALTQAVSSEMRNLLVSNILSSWEASIS